MCKLLCLLRYSTLSSYLVLIFSLDSMVEVPTYQGECQVSGSPKTCVQLYTLEYFLLSFCKAVSIQLRLIGNSYVHAILGVML